MANYNRLGGLPFDPHSMSTLEDVIAALQNLALYLNGQGEPNPGTDSGDVEYSSVYAFNQGAGVYSLWGGNPSDPENPIDLALQSGAGGSNNTFATIVIAGQSDVVADTSTDTLTLVAGSNITLTTNAGTDTITIAASGALGASFTTIVVSGSSDVVADSATDTLTLVAGNLLDVTTDAGTDTITFAVDLTEAGANYASASNLLLGHIANDADVADWDTVSNWLKTLTGYTGSGIELLGASSGTVQWKSLAAWLNLLTSYASGTDQSIGHDASGATLWQNDTSSCP